jgi:hypothetical protein
VAGAASAQMRRCTGTEGGGYQQKHGGPIGHTRGATACGGGASRPAFCRIRDATWPTPYTHCNYSYRSRTSQN